MSASVVELKIEGGVKKFFCPACGEAWLVEGEGMTDKSCEHLLAVVDWVGEFQAGSHLSEEQATRFEGILVEGDHEHPLQELARILPASAAIIELVEPARGGGHSDASVVFIMDLAP